MRDSCPWVGVPVHGLTRVDPCLPKRLMFTEARSAKNERDTPIRSHTNTHSIHTPFPSTHYYGLDGTVRDRRMQGKR